MFVGISLYATCCHSLIAPISYSFFEVVILYVYSFDVSGSVGFLLILSIFLITVSQIIHSIHAVHPAYVISALSSGIGYHHVFTTKIHNDFSRLFISAILTLSLEFLL